MTENDISKIVLDCAFKVHTKLGETLCFNFEQLSETKKIIMKQILTNS